MVPGFAWQVEGKGGKSEAGVKMTCSYARRCAALPVPALEAHGGAAGALGRHIDLALTDTCRGEGGVRRVGGRGHRPARLSLSLIKRPQPDGLETSAPAPPYQPKPPPPPPSPQGHGGLERLPPPHTAPPVQNLESRPKNKQCRPRSCCSPSVTNRLKYHLPHLTIRMIDAQTTRVASDVSIC